MNLPWYFYAPIAAGIIGAVIGGYYHKQYKRNHNHKS